MHVPLAGCQLTLGPRNRARVCGYARPLTSEDTDGVVFIWPECVTRFKFERQEGRQEPHGNKARLSHIITATTCTSGVTRIKAVRRVAPGSGTSNPRRNSCKAPQPHRTACKLLQGQLAALHPCTPLMHTLAQLLGYKQNGGLGSAAILKTAAPLHLPCKSPL